jgi:predicted MPP superfamily phosphohydrolase
MVASPDSRRRDLEERLLPRRLAETSGRKPRNGANLILWYCHTALIPILRFGLKATGLYGRGIRNALNVQVRHHSLSFPDLTASLDGFRLLQLSDLHIDAMEGLTELLCDLLPDLPVDLCVLTGDYRFESHGSCEGVYPRMRSILSAVRSRLGVVGILGNHDTVDMALELGQMGVRILVNESIEPVRGLWVTGADDIDGGAAFRTALDGLPPREFHLTLAHTPQFYAEAAAAGSALYLCGHTHAGQVCLPGGTPVFSNAECPREYTRGLWNHGRMVGFTSAGAGCCMLPVRYNCPPEITVFQLSRC